MEQALVLGQMNGLVFTSAEKSEAAEFIARWHYSGKMNHIIERTFALRRPGGLFGDRGEIVACCVFAIPVSAQAKKGQVELVRLARIENPPEGLRLSYLVAQSVKWMRLHTDYRMVISYADTTHDHHGGIYQATNFYFVGRSKPEAVYIDPQSGRRTHRKTMFDRLGTSAAAELVYNQGMKRVTTREKLLYVYPLAKTERERLRILAEYGYKPLRYPKPDWPGGLRPEQDSLRKSPGSA